MTEKDTARELILLIGRLAEKSDLATRATSEFATHFGTAALDNSLPDKIWHQLERGYVGGFHHGYAAAVTDLASAAAEQYADGAA